MAQHYSIKKLPPLGTLRAFECAARQHSFARAAEELYVTPAAISHQIKQLEQWLGADLFQRNPNGVTLTPLGRVYAAQVREIFDQLISTTRSTQEAPQRTVVRIRSQFSLAAMWLLPRVLELNQLEPDIDVRVIAGPERAVARVGTDIALFHERAPTEGLRKDLLMRGHFRAYAAPSLILRVGQPAPEAMLSFPLLHTTSEDRSWQYPGFSEWFAAAGVVFTSVLPGVHFNLEHLAIAACQRGAGFAIGLDTFCADAVRSGSLVAIPGPRMPTPHAYYLFSKRNATDATKRVRAYLLSRASTP